MTDGLLCIHCGYQETLHGHVDLKFAMVDENDVLEGFKMSLKQCMHTKGFTAEPPQIDPNGNPITTVLWGGDPNCNHRTVPAFGGGVRCAKCSAWYCY